MVCHSGVGLTPLIDGELHHFSAGGLYNGLVLLVDDESGSYWDHITGECVYGPMKGAALPTWGIEMTNVRAELRRDKSTRVHVSEPTLLGRVMGLGTRNAFRSGGILPPRFRGTMAEVDPRLPKMAHGLGVITPQGPVFYPMERIGRGLVDGQVRIDIDPDDGIPVARIGGERPLQFFSRWYGFSLTWPKCSVYSEPSAPSAA